MLNQPAFLIVPSGFSTISVSLRGTSDGPCARTGAAQSNAKAKKAKPRRTRISFSSGWCGFVASPPFFCERTLAGSRYDVKMKPFSPTELEKPRPSIELTSPFEVASSLPKGFARETVETLGRWIVNDRFAPDVVIPTEPQLVEALGVSRATVRDAIKVLSGKGLVRTARRYGTRVTAVEEWNLLDGDVVAWHRSDHPRMRRIFAETTEVRTILEPAAAAVAAHRASEEQR